MELLTREQIEEKEKIEEKIRERLMFLKQFALEEISCLNNKKITKAQYERDMGMVDTQIRELERYFNLPPINDKLDELMDNPLKNLNKIWLEVKKEGNVWN